MFPIQPRRRRQRNEKLTSIRIRPAIRHAEDTGASMLKAGRDLVAEVPVIVVVKNGLAASAGAGGIAGLEHEGGDDSGEGYTVSMLNASELGALPMKEVSVKVASTC